jgi:stalled ribosome rescue protein Dom34
MKKIGIWIDKKEAKIVTLETGKERLETILSKIEDFHVKGGSGTRFKGGPQDVVQDSKYLEREKHQMNAFFEEVVNHVSRADAIVISGPAQTGAKLYDTLKDKYIPVAQKVISVEKTDSMSDNQWVAWVKTYFMTHKQYSL